MECAVEAATWESKAAEEGPVQPQRGTLAGYCLWSTASSCRNSSVEAATMDWVAAEAGRGKAAKGLGSSQLFAVIGGLRRHHRIVVLQVL